MNKNEVKQSIDQISKSLAVLAVDNLSKLKVPAPVMVVSQSKIIPGKLGLIIGGAVTAVAVVGAVAVVIKKVTDNRVAERELDQTVTEYYDVKELHEKAIAEDKLVSETIEVISDLEVENPVAVEPVVKKAPAKKPAVKKAAVKKPAAKKESE